MKKTEETSLAVINEGIGTKIKKFMLNIFGGKKKKKNTIQYNPMREMPRAVERPTFNMIHNENNEIYKQSKIENINSIKHQEEKLEEYHREKRLAKEIENDKINFAEKTVEEIKEMLNQMGKYIEYLRTKIKKQANK